MKLSEGDLREFRWHSKGEVVQRRVRLLYAESYLGFQIRGTVDLPSVEGEGMLNNGIA